MDWARDNSGLSDKDLEHVFKYEEKSTTVVRILADDKTPVVWTLDGDKDWQDWIENECPRVDGRKSGLTLILAKRTGESSFASVKKVQSDVWLERINAEFPGRSDIQRTRTFASLGEKRQATGLSSGSSNMSGRRSVRTLPFSKDIFRGITKSFHIHSSIARVISRADVPVFSSAAIRMKEPDGRAYSAYVYNCRSTNAWDMDLALTATYFPHCGLTFAVLFGCPLAVEEEILKRLSFATAEAVHPLLMTGIFAEIERSRHVHIVEATIDDLETRIFELDFPPSGMDDLPNSEAEVRNQEKRSAWLDTTYLRNALLSWNTQLAKIGHHADELKNEVFKSATSKEDQEQSTGEHEENMSNGPTGSFKRGKVLFSTQPEISDALYDGWDNCITDKTEDGPLKVNLYKQDMDGEHNLNEVGQRIDGSNITHQPDSRSIKEQLLRTGYKIKDRIQAIIDEYDDKIRDCTMRVDGMAMATQWAHGETNVEIALSTNRDSKHMRSIALVTMIFLPGTFFATVFSMTFFNWFGTDGAVVSKYIWIYIVCAVFCTILTIFSWWYFVTYRHSRRPSPKSEEEIPLV